MAIETIVFDWKRTLYDPEEHRLINGADKLLSRLGDTGIQLHLLGKGGDEMMDEVDRLGVRHYFMSMLFVEATKNPEDIRGIIGESHPKGVVVVGDRVSSEIEAGNLAGAITVQVRSGKFADELPVNAAQEPDFVVQDLNGVIPTLESMGMVI